MLISFVGGKNEPSNLISCNEHQKIVDNMRSTDKKTIPKTWMKQQQNVLRKN